jgi:hypothetical protein
MQNCYFIDCGLHENGFGRFCQALLGWVAHDGLRSVVGRILGANRLLDLIVLQADSVCVWFWPVFSN